MDLRASSSRRLRLGVERKPRSMEVCLFELSEGDSGRAQPGQRSTKPSLTGIATPVTCAFVRLPVP